MFITGAGGELTEGAQTAKAEYEDFDMNKVKEELEQRLNPTAAKKAQNTENAVQTFSGTSKPELPQIDPSNYMQPNSQNSQPVSSCEQSEFNMSRIRTELAAKLSPSSVRRANKEIPVLAGTVEIEKYKIKPDQNVTPSSSNRMSVEDFDMNRVKAELQRKLTGGSSASSQSRDSRTSRIETDGSLGSTFHSTNSQDIAGASSGTGNQNSYNIDPRFIVDTTKQEDPQDEPIQKEYYGGYRSPIVSRRTYGFEFLKNLREPSDSGSMSDISSEGVTFGEARAPSPKVVGRSTSFAGGSSPSPKGSPSVARHSSFSRLAERVPSPLRNLFGGGSSSHHRDRTSSESDASSAPPSPRRIPSMTNNSSPLTKTATVNRSLSNGGNQASAINIFLSKNITTIILYYYTTEIQNIPYVMFFFDKWKMGLFFLFKRKAY